MQYIIIAAVAALLIVVTASIIYSKRNTVTELLPDKEHTLELAVHQIKHARVKLVICETSFYKKTKLKRSETVAHRIIKKSSRIVRYVGVSDKELEALPHSPDFLICRFAQQIAEASCEGDRLPSWYRKAKIEEKLCRELNEIEENRTRTDRTYMDVYNEISARYNDCACELDSIRTQKAEKQKIYDTSAKKLSAYESAGMRKKLFCLFHSKARIEEMRSARHAAARALFSVCEHEAVLSREMDKKARQMLSLAHNRSKKLLELDKKAAACKEKYSKKLQSIEPLG